MLLGLMEAAKPVLARQEVNRKRIAENKRPANAIWLWGQGPAPSMPSFMDMHALSGAMISAVDLLRGIAVYAGMEVIDVPGATGTIETNYSGKVKGAIDALSRHDLAYLHIEAPDEASHAGDLEGKIRAIELLDQRVVGPAIEGLDKSGWDWRILLLPDHATPISLKTHSREPVPFVIAGKGIEPDGVDCFDEQWAKKGGYGRVDATSLIGMLAG
jgi:2,3-bisphosphoglycerate-independent phosphoglycerate mutase